MPGGVAESRAKGQSQGSEAESQSQWVIQRCGQEAEPEVRASGVKDGEGQEQEQAGLGRSRRKKQDHAQLGAWNALSS